MSAEIEIVPAAPQDAQEIADIHLTARRTAMPYLSQPHTDEETRAWFAGVVADRPGCWWVARRSGQVAGYIRIQGETLEHLYVQPAWQGLGIGSALLHQARQLSPQRLALWTFQKNARARSFYQTRGFTAVQYTDGSNEEHEPDVLYVWQPPG